MKNKYFLTSITVVMLLLILATFNFTPVMANSFVELCSMDTDGEVMSRNQEKNYDFTLDSNATIKIEIDDYFCSGIFRIQIVDDNNQICADFDYEQYESETIFTDELDAGVYNLKVIACDDGTEFKLNLYYKYDMPEYTISANKINLYIGKTKQLKVESDSSDTKYTVKWSSKNSKIATVNSKGVVTAKSKGKTVITATVDGQKFTCEVSVLKKAPTYSQMVKKIKQYSDRKNFRYDVIDVGNHARFYSRPLKFTVNPTVKTMYGIVTYFQPYIDITKNKDSVNIKLQMKGELYLVSNEENTLDLNKLSFYSNNRRTSFELDYANESYDYDYSTFVRTDKSKWRATFSSNKEINMEQLDKLIKILGQKDARIKISGEYGAYAKAGLTTENRKNWIKLCKYYKMLLKMY